MSDQQQQLPLSYYDDLATESLQAGTKLGTPDSDVIEVPLQHDDDSGSNATGTARIGRLLALLPTMANHSLPDSNDGLALQVAALLATRDWNWKHSIFGVGTTALPSKCDLGLTISIQDERESPVLAGRIWQDEFSVLHPQRLRPVGVVGPISSSVTLTLATLAGVAFAPDDNGDSKKIGVPLLSPVTVASELDVPGLFPTFGRTAPSLAAQAQALTRFLEHLQVQQLALLYINNRHGNDWLQQLSSTTNSSDILLEAIPYQDASQVAMAAAIGELKRLGFVYHICITTDELWPDVLLELRGARWLGDGTQQVWFFESTLFAILRGGPITPFDRRGSALATALNRSALFYYDEPRSSINTLTAAFADFVQDAALMEYFYTHHGQPATLPSNRSLLGDMLRPTIFALNTYDAVMSYGRAICNAPERFPTPTQVFDAIKALDFVGASGRVRYDASTGSRNPHDIDYQIINMFGYRDQNNVFNLTGQQAAIINMANGTIIDINSLVFPSGSSTAPQSLARLDVQENLVSGAVRGVCLGFCAMCLCFSIYCGYWTWKKRNDALVRASQPVFLILLCTGTFILGSAIIPITWQEPLSTKLLDVGCMLDIWLLSTGFSTAFAALFSKTYRINQVYANAKRFRRVEVRAKDVLWPFAVLMFVNVVLLVTWTAVNPLEWERIIIEQDSFNRTLESRGTCYGFDNDDRTEKIFGGLLFAVNFVAVMASNYQGYKARKLPSEFNETFFIGISNLVMLEGAILGFPILFLVENDPTAFMLVKCFLIMVIVGGILVPMFVPKFTHRKDKSEARIVLSQWSENDHSTSRSADRDRPTTFTGRVSDYMPSQMSADHSESSHTSLRSSRSAPGSLPSSTLRRMSVFTGDVVRTGTKRFHRGDSEGRHSELSDHSDSQVTRSRFTMSNSRGSSSAGGGRNNLSTASDTSDHSNSSTRRRLVLRPRQSANNSRPASQASDGDGVD